MAAHTRFTESQLRRILAHYDVGSLVRSKGFKAGYVQTNILLTTRTGRYVLRCYENRSIKSVMFEAELLEHLRRREYPCAEPVKTRDGTLIGSHSNKPYILFCYVPGRHVKNLNEAQLHDLVKHLALLHTITEGYKPRYAHRREPRTKAFCLRAAHTEAQRFTDGEGAERLKIIRDHLRTVALPSELPRGVIHGDFDATNLKFLGEKLTGVLDFDDATYTYLIYDLGVVLLYWTRFYTNHFDLSRARRIIRVYESYRPLSSVERDHLFDALKMHALMVMSWIMYDSWKGKDLFPILSGILDELDEIGRENYFNQVFGANMHE
jgi:homoserine kinase type II